MGVASATGYAGVAELADAPDLGSGVPDVQVQVLSPALKTFDTKVLRVFLYDKRNEE